LIFRSLLNLVSSETACALALAPEISEVALAEPNCPADAAQRAQPGDAQEGRTFNLIERIHVPI
jgi:hypothetical protein